MNTKEFFDHDGDRLEVENVAPNNHDCVYVATDADGFFLNPDDAPAVALAILEAAGIEAAGGPHFVNVAVRVLTDHVQHEKERAERAEREADDAAAKDYLKATNRVSLADRWDLLTPGMQETYRFERRAAQDYFRKIDAEIVPAEIVDEMPKPRVLNYGDPEPEHNTRWQDSGGNVWYYGYSCHRDYQVWQFQSAAGSSFGRWDHLDACFFPMTEVTA